MTSRINLSHPRRKRLQAWLGDGLDERVTQHVEHCDRCAGTLEELAVAPDHPDLAPDDELAEAIRDALAPPDDLNERVMQRIAERERANHEIALILDLFGITRDAADLMMPNESTQPEGRRPAIDPAEEQQREEDE